MDHYLPLSEADLHLRPTENNPPSLDLPRRLAHPAMTTDTEILCFLETDTWIGYKIRQSRGQSIDLSKHLILGPVSFRLTLFVYTYLL